MLAKSPANTRVLAVLQAAEPTLEQALRAHGYSLGNAVMTEVRGRLACMDPRLTVELVPKPLWRRNLRTLMKDSQWEKCKRYVREQSGGVCEICEGVGDRHPVECHERWEYEVDDETRRGAQRLVGLIALCPSCHLAKHLGFASARGWEAEARATLLRVNGWTEQQLDAYLDAEKFVWLWRSDLEWEQDISWVEQTLGFKPDAPRAPDDGHDFTSRVERDVITGVPLPDVEQPSWVTEEEYEHALYEQMLAERD